MCACDEGLSFTCSRCRDTNLDDSFVQRREEQEQARAEQEEREMIYGTWERPDAA